MCLAYMAVACQRSLAWAGLAKPHTSSKGLLLRPCPAALPSLAHCSGISRACKSHLFILVPLKSLLGGGAGLLRWAEVGGQRIVLPIIPQGLLRNLSPCQGAAPCRRSLWSYRWWAAGAAWSQSWAGALCAALQVLPHVQQTQVTAKFCSDFKIIKIIRKMCR